MDSPPVGSDSPHGQRAMYLAVHMVLVAWWCFPQQLCSMEAPLMTPALALCTCYNEKTLLCLSKLQQ